MTQSPYGTIVASPDAVITDSQGNAWSLRNGQVVENGIPDPTTANVIALAYTWDHINPYSPVLVVWQENASRLWWQATSAGWWPAYGTTVVPVPASTDGAVITPDSAGAILDADGNIWTISNGQVVRNGVADPTTANVIEMDYKGGYVWQENSDQLFWSYSQASDGSTVWTPGTLPIARAWIGGDNNDAWNPDNWSPGGVPGRGDSLTMASGTIDIRGNALAGDTLNISPGPASIPYVPPTATVNLRNAEIVIAATEAQGMTIDINVSGRVSKLTLDSLFPTVNVQLDPCSTLIMNDSVSRTMLNVSGGTISFIGDNYFSAFNTVFNDRLVGNATIYESGGGGAGEFMTVNGAVGSGLTFNLQSQIVRDVGLIIGRPDEFQGTINQMDGFVAFMGLHATSGEILNGMLELFNGDELVNATRFTGQTSDPVIGGLQLQRNSAGVMLSNERSANYQPGGPGAALPLSIQS